MSGLVLTVHRAADQIGGLYMRPDAEITTQHTLVQVSARAPASVMSLLTALAFHELTDEQAVAVWIAIRRGSHAPKMESPRLEVTWTAPRFLKLGVTRHRIEGVDVAITDPARTVVDCFKYRSRVGIDVATAALREYLRRNRTGRDKLRVMAEACRVRNLDLLGRGEGLAAAVAATFARRGTPVPDALPIGLSASFAA